MKTEEIIVLTQQEAQAIYMKLCDIDKKIDKILGGKE